LSIRFQADNGLKRIIVDATLRREPRSIFKPPKPPVWTILTTKRFCALPQRSPEFSSATTSERCRERSPRSWLQAARVLEYRLLTDAAVLLVIPQSAPIRDVIETLILIWTHDRASDWNNLIAKAPF
jgi:hypothetical protein